MLSFHITIVVDNGFRLTFTVEGSGGGAFYSIIRLKNEKIVKPGNLLF